MSSSKNPSRLDRNDGSSDNQHTSSSSSSEERKEMHEFSGVDHSIADAQCSVEASKVQANAQSASSDEPKASGFNLNAAGASGWALGSENASQITAASFSSAVPLVINPFTAAILQNVAQSMENNLNVQQPPSVQHGPVPSHGIVMSPAIQQAIASNLFASMIVPTIASTGTSLPNTMAFNPSNNIIQQSLFQLQQQQHQQQQQASNSISNAPTTSASATNGSSASTSASLGGAAGARSSLTNRTAVPLYLDFDEQSLNEYQCLLRKQIELFETQEEDIKGNAQGRNTPIFIGQVGIRCRHCTRLPRSVRPKGSVYYSRTLEGVYQVAQNMAKVHFSSQCLQIAPDLRTKLLSLQQSNKRASGGKQYWVDGLRVHGAYEDEKGVRFRQLELGESGF